MDKLFKNENRDIFQSVIDAIPAPVFFKDKDGKYLGCNEAFTLFTGILPCDLIGKTVFDLYPSNIATVYSEKDNELFCSGGMQKYEGNVRDVQGILRTVQFTKSLQVKPGGEISGIVGVLLDITERKVLENELKKSGEMFQNVFSQSPIGLELYDEKGQLIGINDACLRIFGLDDPLQVIGFKLFDDPNISDMAKIKLQEGETVRYVAPFSFDAVKEKKLYETSKEGVVYLDVIISPVNHGDTSGGSSYLLQIQDVSTQKLADDKLRYVSFHDALTGLYNRSYFEQEFSRMKKSRYHPVGIVVCDIDGLKKVNDTLGHAKGDELIKTAGRIIESVFRQGDIVARIGGDEFAVIIPDATADALKRIYAEIQEKAKKCPGGQCVGISSGFALRMTEFESIDEVFKLADENMYFDKISRRNAR